MGYNEQKIKTARNYVEILELILDINDPSLDDEFAQNPNSYGTPKTTDDPRAYTGVDFRSYRYSQTEIPNLQTFGTEKLDIGNFSSPKAEPSKSIGARAELSVSVKDFKDSDAFSLQGPYIDRASINTSHFCKLFARNNIKNKRAIVYRGYLVNGLFDEQNFTKEHYIISSFSQPKSDIVNFKLSDALKLTNIKNKKIPAQTNGVIAFDIDSSVTSLTFSQSTDEEYGAVGATGRISVNDEFMDFTITSETTMDITRGLGGTVAQEHSAGDTIQLCISNDNYNIIDWIAQIISFSDIPDTYIDTVNWEQLKANDLSSYNLTRTLFKPEAIEKYLNELIVVGGLTMWTDVVSEKIKIITTPSFDQAQYSYGLDDYRARTIKVDRDDKSHVNSQRILWGKVDPTKTEVSLFKSFQSVSTTILPQNLGYTSQGDDIKTEWLNGNDALAAAIANRIVQRFDVPPFKVSFTVDASVVGDVGSENIGIGSIFEYEVPTEIETTASGGVIKRIAQCTSLKQDRNKDWELAGLSYKANIPSNVDLFINEDAVDINLSTLLQSVPDFASGVARVYTVVISQGVTVGSTTTGVSNYSIVQGVFPAGATLSIVNAGEVIGKGGDAGKAGSASWEIGITPDPKIANGLPGQDASSGIIFSTDATVDNLTGLIAGGGGGGQGGRSEAGSSVLIAGGGGGGGAGSSPGNFGLGGIAISNFLEISGSDGFQGGKLVGGAGGLPDGNNSQQINKGNNGGDLGEAGGGGLGGAPGVAINKNGFNVTITAGNNTEQIKGDVIG